MSNDIQPKNNTFTWDNLVKFIKESFRVTVKYFGGKSLASAVMGIICYGILKLLGVENAGAMGIIAGVLNLVPVIGGLAASIICGIIAVFQGPIYILYAILTIIVVQQIDQWILTPLIVGNTVSLPPLIICLALIIGGSLWGPVGVIIAVPVAGIVKIFYSIFVKKKPTGFGKDKKADVVIEEDEQN